MKAPRKPAASVIGLRPATEEMLLVTAETLETELQYGKAMCAPLLNGANSVSDLTVCTTLIRAKEPVLMPSAAAQPWPMPSNIPREMAKRNGLFM